MKLFNLLKTESNNGQFVTETDFINNCDKQMQGALQVLEQLRNLNVSTDKSLKLEYFFYTNTAEKAEQFVVEIKKMNYTVSYGVSASDKTIFVITGWTTEMKMTNEVVKQWIQQMCELGYKFDCEFDGWGTDPG